MAAAIITRHQHDGVAAYQTMALYSASVCSGMYQHGGALINSNIWQRASACSVAQAGVIATLM